jgi:putative RNA 2'-phosphotransferase
VLRHKPEAIDIALDKNGWAITSEILQGLKISMEELEEIVATDNKGRYSFNKDKSKIRANQGHSKQVDIEFKEYIPAGFLYHGTGKKSYDSILKSGIKKMSRQYVHLSHDINTAITVGKRHGEPVVFKIDAVQMYKDGIKFYISENNVVLTDFVSTKYLVY